MTPEQEQRLREIDRHWEEQKGKGIDWYVIDVADLRRYLQEAQEENRRLRERLDRLEGGIQRLIQSYGGDSRDSESGGTSASGLKACRIRNLSL